MCYYELRILPSSISVDVSVNQILVLENML
jgi:hypothetical protein